jgi:hypothetical protein
MGRVHSAKGRKPARWGNRGVAPYACLLSQLKGRRAVGRDRRRYGAVSERKLGFWTALGAAAKRPQPMSGRFGPAHKKAFR